MGCQENSRRTFVLKLDLKCAYCEGCVDKVKKRVKKIQGVDSIKIEEEGKVTISGKVDPHTVIKEVGKDKKITAELWGEEEEEESPVPQVNEQEMQVSVGKIFDQRKVAPQFPDVIVRPSDKPMAKRIRDCYPKHDHELELRSYNKPFTCNGCKEEGFKTRYRCEPCGYDLHEECQDPKTMITHDLFQGSTFVFHHKPAGNICNACGRKIYGCSYHCEVDNLNLHPRCSNLRGKLGIGDTEFVLCKKAKKNCFWCKKKQPSWLAKKNVEGWCYVSKCNKFYCHVYCVSQMVSQMVHEAWKRGDLDRKDDENDDDVTSTALEKVDLKLVAKSRGGGSSGFLRTISMFLRAIIGILFGDPTVVILSMLVELIPR
ncbi:hypothetical protein RHMOL_Rhmol11G0156600 [Rhododendron molle]|uniref:Uncharacterized protein n=2 Tax=Rhododendron molle TaxID=49168 RepID=A0ACC0LTK3_RHOML|nr:hypothetical protein RHMOL_Rhmol11G0156600 [Rhododendron molle]KAI8531708.1 hypothetical protein RHMOL_Rhmol11G0156600 [Rhododendron molle]